MATLSPIESSDLAKLFKGMMTQSSTWGPGFSKTLQPKNKGNNHTPRRSLPEISLSPSCHECHFRRTLNYYPDYLKVGWQKKQREVVVEFGRRCDVPGKYFIHVWKGEETVAYIVINSDEFCGTQKWEFIKKNSTWANKSVKKSYLAILLKSTTYVFQQMNKDSELKLDHVTEFENTIKDNLGVETWWKCLTCQNSSEQSPINLHLTKNALSMVDGREFKPSCLMRWNISEVKDCTVLDEEKFIILFKSGCQLKCASTTTSKEICGIIKIATRPPAPPPRTRGAIRRGKSAPGRDENSYNIKCSTLPSGMRLGGMLQNTQDTQKSEMFHSLVPVTNYQDKQCEQGKEMNSIVVKHISDDAQQTENEVTKCDTRRNTLVRQMSFCGSSHTEESWRGIGSFSESRRSCSFNDLSDLKDMGDDLYSMKETSRQLSKRNLRSQKRSTVKKKLHRLTKRDQMCIKSSHQNKTNACDRDAVTRQISIWEFEPFSKHISDVIYTLKRIMDRKPPEQDTLRLPWGLYHTICCKLIPHYPNTGLIKTKDWRDLAELIGFDNEDIQMIQSFNYQTPITTPQDILLQCWQDRYNRLQHWYDPACTIRTLVCLLEKMERNDIVEDIKKSKKSHN